MLQGPLRYRKKPQTGSNLLGGSKNASYASKILQPQVQPGEVGEIDPNNL